MASPATTKPKRPSFDLSVFDEPLSLNGLTTPASNQPKNQVNVVLELPLEQIEEDPDQPRTLFDEAALADLAKDIQKRGVQQPIIIRPPNEAGIHRIVHGARRYRASHQAGMATIKAIIEADATAFDHYSQVIENTKRENLHAMDIAKFIQARKDAGDTNKKIAEELGETASYITFHLSLLSAPEELVTAFRAGRIGGVQQFYELKILKEKYPAAAAALLAGDGEITRSMILAARRQAEDKDDTTASKRTDAVKQAEGTATSPASTEGGRSAPTPESDNAPYDAVGMRGSSATTGGLEPPVMGNQSGGGTDTEGGAGSGAEDVGLRNASVGGKGEPDEGDGESAPKVKTLPFHNPGSDGKEGSGLIPDPTKIRKPLLLGRIGDRPIKVLLTRLPSTEGMAHVQYEDTMEEAEVVLDSITLTLLTEMRVQEKS